MQLGRLRWYVNQMTRIGMFLISGFGVCRQCWPSRETRQELATLLTIYGFFIGIALAVAATLLYFDFTKFLIAAKPEDDRPVLLGDIRVETIWEANYKPPRQVEEALQRLLMGEAYRQPVFDYEVHEFAFPESFIDFPKGPRPGGPGEVAFRKWRIGSVLALPPDDTPYAARIPLSGDTWEWNIDPQVKLHILSSQGDSTNETAWYKVAIAMVGGYSKIAGPAFQVGMYKDAIDAFKGAVWTFKAKYKVWNSGNSPTRLAKIILGSDRTVILPPTDIDQNGFVIQPGYNNALEFILVPKNGLNTLRSAQNEATYVRENVKLDAPVPEERWVTRGSVLAWLLGGAVGLGALFATGTMLSLGFFRRQRP